MPPFLLKPLLKITVFLVLIFGLYFGLSKFNLLPGYLDLFKKNGPKMANTALIVEDVKECAKLFSQTFFDEIIFKRIHKSKSMFGSDDELIFIAKGKCYAGTDLSKMSKDDIRLIDSVTCEVTLPQSEILETIVNPTDFFIYKEEGYWAENYKATQVVKNEAVIRLKRLAQNSEILVKANTKAKKIMTDFMKSIGFTNVKIEFK